MKAIILVDNLYWKVSHDVRLTLHYLKAFRCDVGEIK